MISKIDQAVQRLDRDFVSSSNGALQRMQEEGSVQCVPGVLCIWCGG